MACSGIESKPLTFKEFLEKVSSPTPALPTDEGTNEEPPVQLRAVRIDPYDESVPLRPNEIAPFITAEAMDYMHKQGCPLSYIPSIVYVLRNKILSDDALQKCKIDRPKGLPDKINYDRYHVTKIQELFASALREFSVSWLAEDTQPPRPLECSGLSVSVHSDRGKRRSMEDRHFICLNTDALLGKKCLDDNVGALCCVFDGHGGFNAAEYTYHQLFDRLLTHSEIDTNTHKAMRESFLSIDQSFQELSELERWKCGSTALVVYMRGTDKMHVGWAGDSQAFLFRREDIVKIMTPHKPEDESEKARIEKAGGVVVYLGAWRVNGVLSVARAIGDIQQKPSITAEPDINTIDLNGEEDYLVMACDGLWDAIDPDKIPTLIDEHFKNGGLQEATAEFLVKKALKHGSMDNITIIVLFFPTYKPPKKQLSQPNKEMSLADYFNK
ncbi:Protein phosphatase 1F [Oopsacas minuta]|uniref:Protein phosphatase 1F n=1 Tax=Oopsacas minuta TaxID=111878 RepID=A0AAV7JB45_9METZ|nr:Protein phosphatase 1F [Oopsacas minuta]